MTRLEQAMRILEDEFDAFIVVGSMFNPNEGSTTVKHVSRGNAYTIEGMIQELCERHYGVNMPVDGGGDE